MQRNYYKAIVSCVIFVYVTDLVLASLNCDGICRDRTLSLIGDINIAVPVNIHNSVDDKFCGDISVSGVQTALAVEWIISILNGNNSGSYFSIPGVKLGYTIYDDCGLPSRTTSFLTERLYQSTLIWVDECNTTTDNSTLYAGIIASTSPAASSTALNIGLPETPVISVNYFDNKFTETPGAFFGVPSVQTEIKATLTFMKHHTWNFIAVVHTEDKTGLEYHEALLSQSVGSYNCYLHFTLNSTNVGDIVRKIITEQNNFAANETFGVLFLGSIKEAIVMLTEIKESLHSIASKLQILLPTKGTEKELQEVIKQMPNDIFLISPQHTVYGDFQDYFKDIIDNPSNTQTSMINAYVEHVCKLQRMENCDVMNEFKQEAHEDRTIVSVMSFWMAVQNMHAMVCSGSTGVCDAFRQNIQNLSEYLKNSFMTGEILPSLDSNSKHGFVNSNVMSVGNNVLNVVHFKGNKEEIIGNYSNGMLYMDSMSNVYESVCRTVCKRCITNEEFKFGYVQGDVIILGLFSVHDTTSNNDDTQFKCGDFRTTAIVTVSAFLESVKDLKQKTGVNFGAVALDDCYNELNITALVTDLFSGRHMLIDPLTKHPIDFSKVVAVVGALSSRVTQRIADIMTSLYIPMVSYAASARSLDDRIRYPYFLRTVPSDALQIQGIVKLLSKLNFNYIGAMYLDDAYGASGIEGVISEAKSSGVCVYDSSRVTESTTATELKQIISDNHYKGEVEVIVIFAIDTVVEKMVGNHVLGNIPNINPIFISSEGWGTTLKLANKESAGSLIFITDSSKQVSKSLRQHLQSLKSSDITENPWLYRFWEEELKCHMPRSFDKLFNVSCNAESRLSAEIIQNLESDQRNIHAELAVTSIAYAYKRLCSSGNCFARNKVSAADWTKAIQNVNIPILDGTNFRPFKNDGNGNLGFSIHNIQKKSNNFLYEMVGSYNGTLTLQSQNIRFYNSIGLEISHKPIQCPATVRCQDVCLTSTSISETSTPALIPNQESSSTDILTIVLGTLAGILFFVVILLIVLVFKALRTKHTIEEVKTASNSMDNLAVPHHHRSNRSLNGIYNEPYSVHSSLNDVRTTHHTNKGFNSDNESIQNQTTSTSSGIVPGSASESAGSRIVYSDMSQTVPKAVAANKNLPIESSNGSNNSLKSLTRRVLQPQHNETNVKSNEQLQDPGPNLTYLSSRDLVMDEEDESGTFNNNDYEIAQSKKLDTNPPKSPDLTPNGSGNMIPPPAYPINDQLVSSKRPQTLPGINPLLLSPQLTNGDTVRINAGFTTPSPEVNFYTNDMYLMPVSDSLPTYQQHIQHMQQNQKERLYPNGIMCSSPSTPYTNININAPYQYKQNGVIPATAMSPALDTKQLNGLRTMSPSSSLGSQSPSVLYLSPAQKETLLTQLLLENPNYFPHQTNNRHTSSGSSFGSPQSNVTLSPSNTSQPTTSPQSNVTLSPGNKSKPTTSPQFIENNQPNSVIELDVGGEVMI